MMETTKTSKEYYVGKRQQTPDKQRGPAYKSPKQEFECMTGYEIKDPEIV